MMWVDSDGNGATIEASYRIIADERGSVRSVVGLWVFGTGGFFGRYGSGCAATIEGALEAAP